MKGGFELISTEGQGSTFSFVLNLKAESDHSEDVEISHQIRSILIDVSAPEQTAVRYTSGLIVEDNRVSRIVIRKMIMIIFEQG